MSDITLYKCEHEYRLRYHARKERQNMAETNISTNTILTSSWNQSKVIGFAFILILVDILAVCGNVLVIVVILRTRELRRRESNYFLVNLSLADLSVGLAIIPVSILTLLNPLVTITYPSIQTFLGFGNFSFCICSIMSLTLLSLDRYFAIVHPYRYLQLLTHKRVLILCVLSWLYSMGFSLPPMFGISSYSCFIPNLNACDIDVWCSYSTTIFAFLVLGLTYVLSLIAMAVAYWKVFKVARQHSRQITAQIGVQLSTNSDCYNSHGNINGSPVERDGEQKQGHEKRTVLIAWQGDKSDVENSRCSWFSETADNNPDKDQSKVKAGDSVQGVKKRKLQNAVEQRKRRQSKFHSTKNELRVARSFLTIVGFYFLCWTPFCLLLMIELVTRTKLTEQGSLICLWFGYVNSCFNPFIHTWKYTLFRKALIKFFHDAGEVISKRLQCLKKGDQ